MGDLLPCPFCGHPPSLYGTSSDGWVGCTNPGCGVQPSAGRKQAKDGGIIPAWNTRALPAASPADHSTLSSNTPGAHPGSGVKGTEAGAGDGVEAPAHAEPVAWAEIYGDVASVSVERTRHHTTPLYAHPPTDAAEIEQLRYIASANQDRAEKADAEVHDLQERVNAEEMRANENKARVACLRDARDNYQRLYEAEKARVAELEAVLAPLPDAGAISTLETVYRNMPDIPELPEAYQPRNIAQSLAALRARPARVTIKPMINELDRMLDSHGFQRDGKMRTLLARIRAALTPNTAQEEG